MRTLAPPFGMTRGDEMVLFVLNFQGGVPLNFVVQKVRNLLFKKRNNN